MIENDETSLTDQLPSYSVLNLRDNSVSFFFAEIGSDFDSISRISLTGRDGLAWRSLESDAFTQLKKVGDRRYVQARLFCSNARDVDFSSEAPLELAMLIELERRQETERVQVICYR